MADCSDVGGGLGSGRPGGGLDGRLGNGLGARLGGGLGGRLGGGWLGCRVLAMGWSWAMFFCQMLAGFHMVQGIARQLSMDAASVPLLQDPHPWRPQQMMAI